MNLSKIMLVENKINYNANLAVSLVIGISAMGIGVVCAIDGVRNHNLTEFLLGGSETANGFFCITVCSQFFDEAQKLESEDKLK